MQVYITISQGSVAADLRRGGRFYFIVSGFVVEGNSKRMIKVRPHLTNSVSYK